MTIKSLVTNLLEWSELVGSGENKEGSVGAWTKVLDDMKLVPNRSNVSRLKKEFAVVEPNDPELWHSVYDEWVQGLVFGLRNESLDAKFADWVNVLELYHPARVAEVQANNSGERGANGSPEGGNTLKSLGISIDLPKYSGEVGACAKWWSQTKRMMVQLRLPEESYLPVVLHLLSGDAKEEFWQRVDSLDFAHDALTAANIDTVMTSLIELFDAGHHVTLLLRWRALMQLKGESALKFRTRYMRIINALATYGWALNDEQRVADFGCRMINWRQIAAHKPRNLDAVLDAVASLGVDAGTDSKPSMPNLMAINEADARNDQCAVSALMVLGGSARDSKRQAPASRRITCYNCSGPHHYRECHEPIKFKCFTCGSVDHLKRNCPKRKPAGNGDAGNGN